MGHTQKMANREICDDYCRGRASYVPSYPGKHNRLPHQYLEGPDDYLVGRATVGDERRSRQQNSRYQESMPDELIRIMDSDRRFQIEQVFKCLDLNEDSQKHHVRMIG